MKMKKKQKNQENKILGKIDFQYCNNKFMKKNFAIVF